MNTRNRISRRTFLSLMGMTVTGGALAACAPAAPPAEAPAGQEAGGGMTIRYRYTPPETHQLGAAQKRHLEANNYQVPDSDIKIELELGIEDDRTMADLAAGTAPDVFWAGYNLGIINAIDEGLFVPAEELMEAAGFDFNDFVDGLEQVYRPSILDNRMWGIPYEQVVVLFAINPQIFADAGVDQPPKDWTWDDVVEVGLQVTRDNAGKHPTDADFNINEVSVWALQLWQTFVIQEYLPYTAGGQYVSDDGTQAMINTDPFVESLQWIRDIYQTHRIGTLSPPEKGLLTGNIGAQETGNWALIDFSKTMPNVDCLYTPVHPGVKAPATPWFDKELWIPKQEDTSRVDAAYAFASWWAFEEYLDFAIDTGYAPFLKSHMNDPKWQEVEEKYPFMRTAMEMPAFATPRFWSLFPGAVEAEKTLAELWDSAVHTQDDIPQLLEAANSEVQRIIDKYRA